MNAKEAMDRRKRGGALWAFTNHADAYHPTRLTIVDKEPEVDEDGIHPASGSRRLGLRDAFKRGRVYKIEEV